jgi:23S rRNA pseudouridine2605 synthase
LTVNRLIRVSYGPFQLGQLKPGEVEELRRKVVRDQLGLDAEADQVPDKPAASKGKTAHRKPRPMGRRNSP